MRWGDVIQISLSNRSALGVSNPLSVPKLELGNQECRTKPLYTENVWNRGRGVTGKYEEFLSNNRILSLLKIKHLTYI